MCEIQIEMTINNQDEDTSQSRLMYNNDNSLWNLNRNNYKQPRWGY